MEKKTTGKRGAGDPEQMIDKVKAWAFPGLMAVVVFFGQDLVRTTRATQESVMQIRVELRESELDNERQDEQLKAIQDKMDKIQDGH